MKTINSKSKFMYPNFHCSMKVPINSPFKDKLNGNLDFIPNIIKS